MSTSLRLVVAVLAVAVSGMVWFLATRPNKKAIARLGARDMQEMEIVVNGRYRPDVVVVKQGIPVCLSFLRNEDNPCSEWVIFSEFGVRRRLQAYKVTPVIFTPDRDGEFLFTCQFGMYRGKLIVQKGKGKAGERTANLSGG